MACPSKVLLLPLVLGCEDPGASPTVEGPAAICDDEGLALEVGPPHADYGTFVDGGELWVGTPPQGGAPYTPYRLRVSGPAELIEGLAVEMFATEPGTDVEVARTILTVVPLCSNTGASEGRWLTETHLRWEGSELAELDGREVDAGVTVSPLADPDTAVTSAARVTLLAEE